MATKTMKAAAGKRSMHPLEFALDFEVKGAGMYLKLATATGNPLGKKLFYSLALEEIEHAKKVDDIHSRLKEKAGWEKSVLRMPPSITAIMKGYFRESKRAELKRPADNLAGYELAMKMERESYKTYNEFRDAAKSEVEKEFYQLLMDQEKEHLDAIVNVYSYLTNTDDWLQEQESKVWNWMNL